MNEKAVIKYNGGALALLCSKCSVIVKIGKEFNETERAFAKGEIDYLPPIYCNQCKTK